MEIKVESRDNYKKYTIAYSSRRKLCSTENPIYVFPKMKMHGLVPNFYIHVSVSNLLYIFSGLVCLFGYAK